MLPALLLSTFFLGLPPHPYADRLALVHFEGGGKPLFLDLRVGGGAVADFLTADVGGAANVGKAGGKKPLRLAFCADLDGDQVDELVLVQELKKKPGRPFELRIHRVPTKEKGSLGKLLASTKPGGLSLHPAVPGHARALGAADVDGDDRDELLVIRAGEMDGEPQALEVRPLPSSKSELLAAPIASDPAFGGAGLDEVVAVCGVDLDQDGIDEVAALRRASDGAEIVTFHVAPAGPGGTASAPLATLLDTGGGTGFGSRSLSRYVPEYLGAEHLVLWQADGSGGERVVVLALPDPGTTAVAVPILADDTPGMSQAGFPLFAVFTARRVPTFPKVLEQLEGTWNLTLSSSVGGPGMGVPEEAWQVCSVQAQVAGNQVVFRLAPGVDFVATATSFDPQSWVGAFDFAPLSGAITGCPPFDAPISLFGLGGPATGQALWWPGGIVPQIHGECAAPCAQGGNPPGFPLSLYMLSKVP